jgi:hypothetical protein
MSIVFITHKQYDMALRRIERANLKKHGRSLSAGSMRAPDLIISIEPEETGGMMVRADWRAELKRRFLVE